MKRIEVVATVLLAVLGARAAEEVPFKPSEADLVAKLFQLSLAQQGGTSHDHAKDLDEPLSDVEYKAICRDLDEITGIDFSRNNTRVRIVGEIADPDDWDAYRRVVSRYEGLVADYVTFRPGPKLIMSLREQISSLGFEIVEQASPDQPGAVAFAYETGVLRLTGWFLSEADIASVRQVVGMQRWLADGEKRTSGSGCVPCEMRLEVVDRLIDVGVVFVSIDRTAAERFGNTIANGKILDFELAGNFVKAFKEFVPEIGTADQGQGKGGYARVSSDIPGVIEAFAEDKSFVMRTSGHTTMNTRDMAKRARYHKGGRMLLKVEGQLAGGDIKEIEYGLTIDCSGRFVRKDEISLDLKLEQSERPQRDKDSSDYDQKKVDATMQVACRLGQTIVLAGSHELSDSETSPSGFMFLRRIPLISWFFSGSSEQCADEHYLILLSPTLLDNDVQLPEKPSSENEKLDQEARPYLEENVIDRDDKLHWYDIFCFWKWVS